MSGHKLDFIVADWNAPDCIVALSTTRQGGVSDGGFSSFNLATHVEDDPERVAGNRRQLIETLDLPSEPQWLQQTHSIDVIDLDRQEERAGDASTTSGIGTVAVVLTADCLPVLFCNRQGSKVAAAHAGWKGLLNGVLEQTVLQMQTQAADMMAWLGPAIGPQQFEVGEEVRQQFMQHTAQSQSCFTQNRKGHYLADLYALARVRLKNLGINHISGGEYCTYTQNERFYSYRRQKVTGRQASLIYIKK